MSNATLSRSTCTDVCSLAVLCARRTRAGRGSKEFPASAEASCSHQGGGGPRKHPRMQRYKDGWTATHAAHESGGVHKAGPPGPALSGAPRQAPPSFL